MVLAVVNLGVTPLPVLMDGDTVPLHKIACAPVGTAAVAFAVAKKVTMPVPPVPAVKSMFATGVTVPLDSAHPVVERATLTRP